MIQYTDNKKNIHKGDQNHEQEKNYGHLAAGVFSAVSVNPTAVMADSDTEPTTETGEMFYVDGDSTDGQMIVSEDGTPLQKTVKASEMGMSSEETPRLSFYGTLCRASR